MRCAAFYCQSAYNILGISIALACILAVADRVSVAVVGSLGSLALSPRKNGHPAELGIVCALLRGFLPHCIYYGTLLLYSHEVRCFAHEHTDFAQFNRLAGQLASRSTGWLASQLTGMLAGWPDSQSAGQLETHS